MSIEAELTFMDNLTSFLTLPSGKVNIRLPDREGQPGANIKGVPQSELLQYAAFINEARQATAQNKE
jgi:hypothetical protein